MPKPRLLVASVTAADPKVLSAHLSTVRAAASNCDAEVEFLYLIDPSAPHSAALSDVLIQAGVRCAEAAPKQADAHYRVGEQTHEWSTGAFYWLGAQKERLLDHARASNYDAILLVDSDLILAPDTLRSMMAAQKPIVSAVFWTRWQPEQPALPNVWLQHPYGFEGNGETGADFLRRLENRELVRVRGLGACTLISKEALQKVSFRPIEGLPSHGMWQGEDRHFCLNAERAHVEMWADAWPDIFHCYRPSDAQLIDEAIRSLSGKPKPPANPDTWIGTRIEGPRKPRIGDLISLTLEPLEEPQLAGYTEHVRGRLGRLNLLPDLEACILSMRVGEERFLPLAFPASYPLAEYRGLSRLVRVRLLGAKPYRKPLPDGLSSVVQASA